MIPILTADCVAKSYGSHQVLSSATLRAVPGELRVIFGRNGVGKSTLVKIAAGQIAPDSGVVHFAGRAYLSATLPKLAAAGLVYLPDHELLSSAFTVGAQRQMMRARFCGADIADVAERLGITALLDRRPHELSGGERRRADIAAALVRQPKCLLADEPYRGIAPRDAALLTRIFRDMAASGVAVVVTGHEVPTLMDAAHHITWSTSGTTYELGPPPLAAQHEPFRREYLGSWYSP